MERFWRRLPNGLWTAAAVLGMNAIGCSITCFRAGTKVSTPDGTRPIEDLREGDVVWAATGQGRGLEQAIVGRTYFHPDRPVWRLASRAGATTMVSPDHPYFVPDVGFRSAATLDESSALLRLGSDGGLSLDGVRSLSESPMVADVYNLHVLGPNTYFADGLLVHNKSPLPSGVCDLGYSNYEAAADADFDGDGIRLADDCDDEDPSVGECSPGEARRSYWCLPEPDAGAPDSGVVDDGGTPTDGG